MIRKHGLISDFFKKLPEEARKMLAPVKVNKRVNERREKRERERAQCERAK